MTKKYELIKYEDGLYQIRALRDIPRHNVKAGDWGGFVSGEHNLSQEGDCWLDANSSAYFNSVVSGNALLKNSYILKEAHISGNAILTDCRAELRCNVSGNVRITGVKIQMDAIIIGDLEINASGSRITGSACISKQEDFLILGPARSSGRYSIAYRQIDGSVQVTTGCFTGTLDEYAQAIKARHSGINRLQYMGFHKQFKQYFRLMKYENPFLSFLKHLY